MSEEVTRLPVPALPKNIDDLLRQRLTRRQTSMIDRVDDLLKQHIDDPALQRYLEPVSDDESETGKCRFDDFKAAERIQVLAVENGDTLVANQKTTVVMRALQGALRRYGMTRSQRIAAANGTPSAPSAPQQAAE